MTQPQKKYEFTGETREHQSAKNCQKQVLMEPRLLETELGIRQLHLPLQLIKM